MDHYEMSRAMYSALNENLSQEVTRLRLIISNYYYAERAFTDQWNAPDDDFAAIKSDYDNAWLAIENEALFLSNATISMNQTLPLAE